MQWDKLILENVEISAIELDDVLVFDYNGDTRCLKVEKSTGDYVQGKCLVWDDVLPSRRFASFRFDRIDPATGGIRRVTNASRELYNFDLADVR